jgi:hypothetical protein
MTNMTDKLITPTTGIALYSFDSQLVRRATLWRTKNYLHLTEKKPIVSSTKLRRLSKILFTPPDGQPAKYHYD